MAKPRRQAFDESKDLLVKTYKPIETKGGSKILAEAYSYNGGPIKLQLVRVRDKRRGKLGRITNEEAGDLIPVLSQFDLDLRSGLLGAIGVDEERVQRKAAQQEAERLEDIRAAEIKLSRDMQDAGVSHPVPDRVYSGTKRFAKKPKRKRRVV